MYYKRPGGHCRTVTVTNDGNVYSAYPGQHDAGSFLLFTYESCASGTFQSHGRHTAGYLLPKRLTVECVSLLQSGSHAARSRSTSTRPRPFGAAATSSSRRPTTCLLKYSPPDTSSACSLRPVAVSSSRCSSSYWLHFVVLQRLVLNHSPVPSQSADAFIYWTPATWLGLNSRGEPFLICSSPLVSNFAAGGMAPAWRTYRVYVSNLDLDGPAEGTGSPFGTSKAYATAPFVVASLVQTPAALTVFSCVHTHARRPPCKRAQCLADCRSHLLLFPPMADTAHPGAKVHIRANPTDPKTVADGPPSSFGMLTNHELRFTHMLARGPLQGNTGTRIFAFGVVGV